MCVMLPKVIVMQPFFIKKILKFVLVYRIRCKSGSIKTINVIF